jgi:hypothetical protein
MGSFPYNTHRYNDTETVNGCPLNYREAFTLAEKLLYWHSVTAQTDSWTQSGDGAYENTVNIAHGLMELFSDPGAVQRLEMTGHVVRERVKNMMDSEFDDGFGFFVNARRVVRPLFYPLEHGP